MGEVARGGCPAPIVELAQAIDLPLSFSEHRRLPVGPSHLGGLRAARVARQQGVQIRTWPCP